MLWWLNPPQLLAGSKDIAKDTKGTGIGSGFFFPLAAAQRWDLTADSVQNGIYLSHVAALVFKGKMVIKVRRSYLPWQYLVSW